MKTKGDIRAIDDLGRVVIPMTFRKMLGINPGDMLDMSLNENGEIIITKTCVSCVFCASSENLQKFESKHVCAECIKKLSEK